jgi:hypothetical protein
MKINLFLLAFILPIYSFSQDCTALINNGVNQPGVYPQLLAGSFYGENYDEIATIVLANTMDNFYTPTIGDSILSCASEISSLSNIPAGYSYEIWGLNSGIPYPIALGQTIVMDYTNDNTKICIRLKNVTPPMSSDMFDGNLIVDSVNIELIAGYWADLGAGCSFVGGALGLNDTM